MTALGLGLWLLSQNAALNDDYQAALEFGQQAGRGDYAHERVPAINNHANSLVLLKRLREGVPLFGRGSAARY